jgi:hypothetical protein
VSADLTETPDADIVQQPNEPCAARMIFFLIFFRPWRARRFFAPPALIMGQCQSADLAQRCRERSPFCTMT